MKSIEEMAEMILDEFRKTKSKTRHIVMLRVIRHKIFPVLNPKELEKFSDAANLLINEGYITYEQDGIECFRLTEKGYNNIYEDDFTIKASSVIQKKSVPSTDFPDEIYRDVIAELTSYGKDLEQKPSVYKGKDEPELRDHFLTILNGRYNRTTATGETFNKEGKTDIILKDDKGYNIFIAECKWWAGAKKFHDTIDQLFDNYLSWRDTKVAVIFFVDNKEFSDVLDQIETEAKNHQYFIKFIARSGDSNFSCIFRQKDDEKKLVKIEFMFFHFPQ